MAPDFYFFTDTNLISPSSLRSSDPGSGAFGPVGTVAGKDEYRISSIHQATSNPTAYAVCDGVVCVQKIPSTSPPLVNIVLRPLVQPALNFVPIKYIIYKGILASSLINGTETAAAANNRLTQFIWDEQAKKNTSAGTSHTPPAEALGADLVSGPELADVSPLDNLFFRAGASFQLPLVKGGWSIGQFDKTRFGIEVLLDGLGFLHSLSLARQLENRISVAALAGGETAAQEFDHWHAKEQVLGYMDPCAFYGSFFRAGIRAKASSDAQFGSKAGNDLYHHVLSPFANRNIAYLDIRNEHNFGFNYFKNYGTSIQLTCDPDNSAPAPVDYYASKWPLLALPASGFPATNTTKARNRFRIQLSVGDNLRPLIYVSQGYRDVGGKSDAFPAELKSPERFYDAFEPPVGGYTATKNKSGLTSMTFVVPNVTGQAVTTPVSCYVRLKYLKQQPDAATTPATAPTTIRAANHLDNLVYPFELRALPGGNASIKSSVYEEEVYVDARNVAGLRCDFIANVGIARDASNTSFLVIPTNVRTSEGLASALVTLSGESTDGPESYASMIAAKYPLKRVAKTTLLLSATDTVPTADFVSDTAPAGAASGTVTDFSKLLVLVVCNATYDSWTTRTAAAGAVLDRRFRIYLGIRKLQTHSDTAGVDYTSFELVLRGFALDTATCNYQVQEMNTDPIDSATNITVYALAPESVTCAITSGADGMSTACVRVGGIIQLTAVPSSGSGTYQWSTTSSNITLNNTASQKVMVMAKSQVSASRGEEKVRLVFTPTGGAPLAPVTRDVTVISVEFSKSAIQNYGYDDMDNAPGENHHVSVKRQGFTTVHVAILGGGMADDLEFVSDDVTIAEPVAPKFDAGASFDLTIAGKNRIKAQTTIRAVSKGGPECAAIDVNVYRELLLYATVARVYDKANPATALANRPFDVEAAAAQINTTYRSVVAKLFLTDASPTCDPISVPYDEDSSGSLTLRAGVVGPEIEILNGAIAAGNQRVYIVRRVAYVFYLATAASPGDISLTLDWAQSVDLTQLDIGKSYDLGTGDKAEKIVLASRTPSTNVFTLSETLKKSHGVDEGIIRPIGGVASPPGTGLLVIESGVDQGGVEYTRTTELVGWMIGHEIGHRLLGLIDDVVADTNLMHYNADFVDHQLRFKAQAIYKKPGLPPVNQWEAIKR